MICPINQLICLLFLDHIEPISQWILDLPSPHNIERIFSTILSLILYFFVFKHLETKHVTSFSFIMRNNYVDLLHFLKFNIGRIWMPRQTGKRIKPQTYDKKICDWSNKLRNGLNSTTKLISNVFHHSITKPKIMKVYT